MWISSDSIASIFPVSAWMINSRLGLSLILFFRLSNVATGFGSVDFFSFFNSSFGFLSNSFFFGRAVFKTVFNFSRSSFDLIILRTGSLSKALSMGICPLNTLCRVSFTIFCNCSTDFTLNPKLFTLSTFSFLPPSSISISKITPKKSSHINKFPMLFS